MCSVSSNAKKLPKQRRHNATIKSLAQLCTCYAVQWLMNAFIIISDVNQKFKTAQITTIFLPWVYLSRSVWKIKYDCIWCMAFEFKTFSLPVQSLHTVQTFVINRWHKIFWILTKTATHHSSSAAITVETIRNMYARATRNLRFYRTEF